MITACSQPEAAQEATHAFQLIETYGETSPRSVSLHASWGESEEQTIELADVRVTLTPGEQPMVQKLETLLEETGFQWKPQDSRWPELARAAPPDAVPMISRIQLALLLLEGSNSIEVEQPFVDVFSQPPTMGITHLKREGEEVALSTIALIMSSQGAVFAWAQSQGKADKNGVQLTGTRQVDGGPRDPISTTIRKVSVQTVSQAD
ncbi:MAG: hypothetical protein ACPGU1_04835 [Myxococcota bacterium]